MNSPTRTASAPPGVATRKIGNLAERSGTTTPTIRYHDEIGLLPRPARQGGVQRRHGMDTVHRLTFIRRCRNFGFSVEQVRDLVALNRDPQRDFTAARDIGRAHLATIRQRPAELRLLKGDITEFVESCETTCAGGPGPACVPLVELGTAPRQSRGPRAPERRARI